jgi:hypothetical protein
MKWPVGTAKRVARAWGIDVSTAANVVKGHIGARALTRAVEIEGYDLLDHVGKKMTGISRTDWARNKITNLSEELRLATHEYDRLCTRSRTLETLAIAPASAFKPGSHEPRRENRETPTFTD